MKHHLIMNSAKLIPFISGFIGIRKSNAVTVELEIPGPSTDVTSDLAFNRIMEKPTEQTKFDIMEFAARHHIPGIQCSVAIGDGQPNVIYHGYSDVESRYEVNGCTKFRQGEISMLHVAYLTLKMIHIVQTYPLVLSTMFLAGQSQANLSSPTTQGQQELERKVQIMKTVQIEELLRHRGGFRDFDDAEKTFLGSHVSPRAPRVVANRFLEYCVKRFDLSTWHDTNRGPASYSRHGYHILALYLGKVLGANDLGVMFDNHFQKEGLTETATDKTLSITMQRARHYQVPTDSGDGKGILQPISYQDPFIYVGAHGFLSTSKDLARFGQKLLIHGRHRPAPGDTNTTDYLNRRKMANEMFSKFQDNPRKPTLLKIEDGKSAISKTSNSFYNEQCYFGYVHDKDSVNPTPTGTIQHQRRQMQSQSPTTDDRKALAVSNTMGASNVLLVKGIMTPNEQGTETPITVAIMTNRGMVGKGSLATLAEKIAERYQKAAKSSRP